MEMPEEINRILTDRISNILFCPTETAVNNLKKEGYDNFDAKIVMSGDVMYDAAKYYKQKAGKPNINLPEKYILSTVHRAENTDNPERLQNIFTALNEIAASVPVVLPLHPRTRKILDTQNIDISNLHIIEPVGYLEMIWLITHSSLVMTDSGGLQKEAYFFEKQCITLRDETEWIELVTNGFNTITGADKREIIDTVQKALAQKIIFDKKLYGNGDAAKIIIDSLTKY
jgi:UDP-GlcNAc3NAcA epimerase